MRRQQGRVTRTGSARRSDTLARGAGDPRDRRREAQRLTDSDLDPAVLHIVDGRLTLVDSATKASGPKLVDLSAGAPSNTVAPIPDLVASPATVADLHADLLNVTLPAIRNALAALAAAVNSANTK